MKILILIFFFEIKESKITRGHNYTLVKKQSRLDVRKYSFSQRTINVWNNLSTDCVHASSVNMFKNKIDKYLVKAGYTYYKGQGTLRNYMSRLSISYSFLVYCHLRCSLDGNLLNLVKSTSSSSCQRKPDEVGATKACITTFKRLLKDTTFLLLHSRTKVLTNQPVK